ncbi:glycerate kinase [Nesterenkonia sp. PF2B19]|uniref:glycerate kinase n=1 Tax=Nesterenkonia sp. PF2B19 TaxID=1881858 RepID=UPI00191C8F1E|nr:glycerate kinase [Nesterenkonia sp. PF2B19]
MASTAAGPRTSTVVIAPDTFKGSLGAGEVAQALASGIRRSAPGARVVEVPMADGGEGTLDAAAAGWEIEAHRVTGPDGRPARARLGLRTTTAAQRPPPSSNSPRPPGSMTWGPGRTRCGPPAGGPGAAARGSGPRGR